MTAVVDQDAASARPSVAPGALWIGGRPEAAADGATRAVLDPATGRPVASVAEGGARDITRAVTAARAAADSGVWSDLPPRARAEVLTRVAGLIREHAEDLARLESLDVGKPLMFTRMIDVPTAADTYAYYAQLAASIEGAARTPSIPAFAYTRREPYGVVGAITPFNFPMILSATKLAPALVAGNTVVHKPAEDTPLSALRIAELFHEAGLPDGVLNVVTGGADAGQALVADRRVDKIAFTGSSAVGRAVAQAAGATLKPVLVELGGKGANIIFADADIEAAIGTAINAFVFNTGQFCMAGSRLLVERPVYDVVVEALSGAVGHVPVGDPFADGVVVGPMAGPRHEEKVRRYLQLAVESGYRVVSGPEHGGGGFFAPPSVVVGVDQDSPLIQEEVFGPVLTVQPFDTEDEAVAMANGTPYGLAAGLQTSGLARAHRIAAKLRAGIVWVNGWSLLDVQLPFGGTGQSGYGRENGPEALDEYLRTKSVLINLG
jgi:acyl-CoA reductase-like NAD-dependent aldehyde dehydrogenase